MSKETKSLQLEEWEKLLIKNIDLLDYFSVGNVFLTAVLLNLIGFPYLNPSLGISAILGVLVWLLNRKGKYIISLYLFYSIGIFLIGSATYYMEIKTNVFMYFFPISLSIVLLLGKEGLRKHMYIWYGIYFFTVVLLFLYASNRTPVYIKSEVVSMLAVMNSLLSFFLSIVLVVFIAINNQKREAVLTKTLHEKELLLAELFHRVKNNLNVVTSILSLKGNASTSEDVKNALEECKSRVYSMALVHQQVYAKNEVGVLNMRSYLSELIRNIQHTMGNNAQVAMNLEKEHVDLPIAKAIPVGLIVNELLTNSYKHAGKKNDNLNITVNLSVSGKNLRFCVVDNGIGFNLADAQKNGSLGLEIVQALCEQIDANFFQNPSSEGAHLILEVSY